MSNRNCSVAQEKVMKIKVIEKNMRKWIAYLTER